MARHGGKGGCVGCLAVVSLGAAILIAVLLAWAPPMLRSVLVAYRHRALEMVGMEETVSERVDREALGYAGSLLDEGQQDVYLQLLDAALALNASFDVYEAAPQDVEPALKAVLNDHPELFWLDGSCTYSYSSLGDVVTVELGLSLPIDQVPATREHIEALADEFLNELPSDASEYAIAQAAYEYVITTTDYVIGADQSQNIQSVFLSHASVCAGYAHAYQYLLQRAGMFCAYVDGSISTTGDDHAWDMVRIDGSYAYVDPTWGDPAYGGDASQIPHEEIIYDYLCLTTEEMLREHHVIANQDAWPTCNDAGLDYYGRCGLLFDAYDQPALSQAFWEQANGGATSVCLKFSNDEAYALARDALQQRSFLRDDLLLLAQESGHDSLRYSYTLSDGLRIIKLYW